LRHKDLLPGRFAHVAIEMPIATPKIQVANATITKGCPHFAVEMLNERKGAILVSENGVEFFNVFSVHFSSRVLFYLL